VTRLLTFVDIDEDRGLARVTWATETVEGKQGVYVEAADLRAVPHDVELSDRVLARIGRGKSDAPLDVQ
jgi:hypothetical protein